MTIFFGSKVCQLTCEEWLTMLWLSLHDNQLLSADVRLALHVVVFVTTGLMNKVCPRLRDSVFWHSGEITQPRTSLIREPCTHKKIADALSIALLDSTLGPLD